VDVNPAAGALPQPVAGPVQQSHAPVVDGVGREIANVLADDNASR
jgi:hypothetical protein